MQVHLTTYFPHFAGFFVIFLKFCKIEDSEQAAYDTVATQFSMYKIDTDRLKRLFFQWEILATGNTRPTQDCTIPMSRLRNTVTYSNAN